MARDADLYGSIDEQTNPAASKYEVRLDGEPATLSMADYFDSVAVALPRMVCRQPC